MKNQFEGQPVVFITKLPNGKMQTHLYGKDMDYRQYGLLIADLIRHVGRAFYVPEDDVYAWVQKEMAKPTTPVESLQRTPPQSVAPEAREYLPPSDGLEMVPAVPTEAMIQAMADTMWEDNGKVRPGSVEYEHWCDIYRAALHASLPQHDERKP